MNQSTLPFKEQVHPKIASIGVTSKGNSEAVVVLPNGSMRSISICTKDFAMLAAAGVRVVNGR